MSLTKVLIHTLLFIIITALVYILYYNVVMEIVFGSVYDGLNPVMYEVITVGILLFMDIFALYLMEFIINRKMPRMITYILLAVYSILLLLCFLRSATMWAPFELNPADTYWRLAANGCAANIGFAMISMVPFGVWFRNMSLKKLLPSVFAISVIFELMQVAIGRGYFAVLDIAVYLIGVLLGYFAGKAFVKVVPA